MANPTIGEIECAHCGGLAEVRKYSKGKAKLYYVCEGCGMVTPNLERGQNWILEHARMYGPDGKPMTEPPPPEPVNEPEPPAEPASPPAPAPVKEPRRSFADDYLL